MQLYCHGAAELDKHAYIMGHNSKQCSYVAMQLRKLRCIFHEPKWQTVQLCCHAAAGLDTHAYIMDQNSRQCSYVAMQLRNLTNMHIYIFIIMGQSGKHTAKNSLLIIRILVLKVSKLIHKMNHTSNSKTALIKIQLLDARLPKHFLF